MQTHPRKRMLVLGLDGLPLSLAHTLCADGRFPALASLLPAATQATAELPELSPVNWTSFFTAQGPETHGVFGFTRIHAQSYEIALADSSTVQCPTIFDTLGESGLHTRILNLPNTYPARPVRGMTVAGFVAHDLQKAVYPPFLYGPMRGIEYMLEADTNRGLSDPAYLLEELRKSLASRRRAFDLLWPDLAWDCFVFVLTETDRLFHFLYDAVEEQDHPLHSQCLDILDEWDALIGHVLERFHDLPENEGPHRLMVLADHGFTRLITEVDLNAILRQHGLLRTTLPPEALDELQTTAIAPSSKAFALDPGRIYLHTADRFAKGSVHPDDAPALRDNIRAMLMQLTYEGRQVFKAIHTRESLYNGPMLPYAPDLICEPVAGFDLKAKFNRNNVFGFFGRTGTHTVRDAFFYDSQENRNGKHSPQDQTIRLRDSGRRVLEHFGLPMPDPDNGLTGIRTDIRTDIRTGDSPTILSADLSKVSDKTTATQNANGEKLLYIP